MEGDTDFYVAYTRVRYLRMAAARLYFVGSLREARDARVSRSGESYRSLEK